MNVSSEEITELMVQLEEVMLDPKYSSYERLTSVIPNLTSASIQSLHVIADYLVSGNTTFEEAKGRLAELLRKTSHYVLVIHGIRDQAHWQSVIGNRLRPYCSKVIGIKYDYYFAVMLLFRWCRKYPTKKLLEALRHYRSTDGECRLSVIAHSYGTFITSRILAENSDIRLYRLILCGAIISRRFDWSAVQSRIRHIVINECGTHDPFPVLAQSMWCGYGASGRFGFGCPHVMDRYHRLGHSGFLTGSFVERFWAPLFRSESTPVSCNAKGGWRCMEYLGQLPLVPILLLGMGLLAWYLYGLLGNQWLK